VAGLLVRAAPALTYLRVRRLAAVSAGDAIGDATFAALRQLDVDLWPLTWLAAIGVAHPGAPSLANALRTAPALATAMRTAEARYYYWGGLSRVDADIMLSNVSKGVLRVRWRCRRLMRCRRVAGSFLVRFSERTNQLVVSCRDVESGKSRHVLCLIDKQGVQWDAVGNQATYESLDQLLVCIPRMSVFICGC
jgi:hypothetical protein